MEYLCAGLTLGINTPSQCGILNSFPIYWLFVGVDVNFAHFFMMRRRIMCCEIICQILIARAPTHINTVIYMVVVLRDH
jgi:hypothetical protein